MTTQDEIQKKKQKEEADLEAHRVNIFLHAENVRVFDQPHDRQLPVTIVTGFLGSGKTTLLRHILTNKSNLRIAAAVNDFAELNIDENLIRHQNKANKLLELSNGCVCCHLLDDLKSAVWQMLGGAGSSSSSDLDLDAINYLVIETSGVSDPYRIIKTLDAKFGKCYRARLDSVVTVVDVDQMIDSLGEPMSQAALAQLECADVIMLNKVDLLKDPEQDCQTLEQRIRTFNESAVFHRTNHCHIPLSAILDVQLPDITARGGGPITHEGSEVPIYVSATGGALRRTSSLSAMTTTKTTQHDDFVSISVSLTDRPLSLERLQQFVTSSLVQRLTRMKGVVWVDACPGYRCVLHLSGRGRLGFHLDGKWTGPPQSETVCIGRSSTFDATELEQQFRSCQSSLTTADDSPRNKNKNNSGLEILKNCQEFIILESACTVTNGLIHFRLVGTKVYGYTEEEIERDLRIDTDAMNRDLADAVNASVDRPKAFLAYTTHAMDDNRQRLVLCHVGQGDPANNVEVLLREAKECLATHFRNVQVCKCGA